MDLVSVNSCYCYDIWDMVEYSDKLLKPNGILYFTHNEWRTEKVMKLLLAMGYYVSYVKDFKDKTIYHRLALQYEDIEGCIIASRRPSEGLRYLASTGCPVVFLEDELQRVRLFFESAKKLDQTGFVAPNAVSIAQAYFSDKAWFRAIYAGDTLVGFSQLYADTIKPEYFLWRFMIDQRYQGMGYGFRAMELIIDHVKTLPKAATFETSVVQEPGGPQKFYEKLGFELTGGYEDGEAVMRLKLT